MSDSAFFDLLVFISLQHGAFTEHTRNDGREHILELDNGSPAIDISHCFVEDELIGERAEAFDMRAQIPDEKGKRLSLGEMRRTDSGLYLFYLDHIKPRPAKIPYLSQSPIQVLSTRSLCVPTDEQYLDMATVLWDASQRKFRAIGQ